jgi:DNA-directed RNA polymerase III subunit RPC1
MSRGHPIFQVMETWDHLQLQCAMYINGDIPGSSSFTNVKPIRGLCVRLKGKGGRFRGNLSGKRVDFSGRTVISPDPNLNIDQVCVPQLIAKTLTYPERVTAHNIERLRKIVMNGANIWPGAQYVITDNGAFKTDLRFNRGREHVAKNLKPGDVVERHIQDDDIVLFNRQPSLHKLSIMVHKAKIMHWRTLRFNECVCTPYNADFDGDEMNLHVPQTEEARAEAMVLMGVTANLVTPRNGEPLVAATQDFLTGSFLLTRKDTFFDRARFAQVCAGLSDGNMQIDLPPPAIVKPCQLWTGKQVFYVLIRPNKSVNVSVNLEVRGRTFQNEKDVPQWLDAREGYVVFSDSELLCGTLDKTTLGSGSKNNLFHVLMRDYGPEVAADRMSRLARMTSRWLANQGFSIGIADVTPSEDLLLKKRDLVASGYHKCDEYIAQYQARTLPLQAGCNLEETLEAKLNGELSDIRKKAGDICIANLHYLNAPLIMALCGSKGSNINISQMVTCVGQQVVSGKRVPNGFVKRTLPHFEVDSRKPNAKGFVLNSFYSGMTPTEFFFHTMGGREGLVDTAVKTAETGYMQRRLMKALEDLSVQYDWTVRDSVKGIVQFAYGDDSLDPAGMEGKERPVDFGRILQQVKTTHPCPEEPSLSHTEVQALVDSLINTMDKTEQSIKISDQFRDEVGYFFRGQQEKRDNLPIMTGYVNDLRDLTTQFAACAIDAKRPSGRHIVDKLHRVTKTQLEVFFDTCLKKYERAIIEPGTAVGALGAQSIGEPGTQMTLKTFHFAGVASMNITLGVPRIKEIINATRTISTPIITAPLVNDKEERPARIIKGRIERTTLGEITEYVKEVFKRHDCYLSVKIHAPTIQALQLEINADTIKRAILATPKLKLKEKHVQVRNNCRVRIYPVEQSREQMFFSLQALKNAIPRVIVSGIPTVERAIINHQQHKFNLIVEGYNMGAVMAIPGVVATQTKSNNVIEVQQTLGIEAARKTIIHEMLYTMESHGIGLDTRHVMLLADIMTYKGEVLGITRFGIGKMKDSVLMLASFEKTTDHLFDAAVHARRDPIEGVSECIIMGAPVPLGTGILKVLRKQRPISFPKRPPLLLGGQPALHLTS